MNYKAVIVDLDGTLLNDERKVSEKDYNALVDLGRKGIKRVIATGRSLYSFTEVIPDDFPIDYLIIAAGGGTFDFQSKRLIRSHSIVKPKVIEIVKKLDFLKLDYQVRAKIPESHMYFFKQYSTVNPDFERLNTIYKNFIFELNSHEQLTDAARIIVIAQNTEIVDLIESEFSEYGIIRATSPIDHKSVWMEIYPKGVNKGSALIDLCNDLKINLDSTTGIGNDYNDIHFLNITHKSFIVSNAPDILKAKYQVICSNNEDPLSFVLDII